MCYHFQRKLECIYRLQPTVWVNLAIRFLHLPTKRSLWRHLTATVLVTCWPEPIPTETSCPWSASMCPKIECCIFWHYCISNTLNFHSNWTMLVSVSLCPLCYRAICIWQYDRNVQLYVLQDCLPMWQGSLRTDTMLPQGFVCSTSAHRNTDLSYAWACLLLKFLRGAVFVKWSHVAIQWCTFACCPVLSQFSAVEYTVKHKQSEIIVHKTAAKLCYMSCLYRIYVTLFFTSLI